MPLYVVPDPTLPAVYVADGGTHQRFMGSVLVEYRHVDGVDELWQIGDLAGFTGESLIASNVVAGWSDAGDMAACDTYAVVVIFTDDGNFQFWVVGADGSQDTEAGGVAGVDPRPRFTDQRLEPTVHGIFELDTSSLTKTIEPIPADGAVAALDLSDPTSDWNQADTWAAFVRGDNTSDRTQPEAPDPFDVTKTSHGNHLTGHALTFNYFQETGDKFTGAFWENARITWTLGAGYEGTATPVIDFGRFNVGTLVHDIPAATDTELFLSSTQQDACIGGYRFSPNPDGSPTTGSPALILPDGQPDGVPDDALDFITVTLTSTVTFTPEPAHAYKIGEYRYLNFAVDNMSAYGVDGEMPPGTEWMQSDFIDAVDGRRTAVVGLYQESDLTDGGTQCSFAVHFEPFGEVPPPTGVVFAPLRRYPRDDGLASSSARRFYPPNRSIQRSNRRAGGYL